MRELDTVVLTRDITEHGLVKGDIGTIVHVYPLARGFEVEFVVGDGSALAVLTLKAGDIRPIADAEILHARDTSSV